MTTVERVEKMLANEKKIIERTDSEIIVDFKAVKAELRAECLDEVLRLFEPVPV